MNEFIVDKNLNPTITSIFDRYSCRKYENKPIPEDVLNTIIECGRFAPTGGNNQSIKFIVITNPEIRANVVKAAEKEFAAMEIKEDMYGGLKNSISLSKKGGYDFAYKAPVIIVLVNDKAYGNAMADSVCANMSMMIAATSLGIGNCYLNQLHWLDESKAIRELLNISDGETICCSLGLGYSAHTTIRDKKIKGNPVVRM